MSHSGVWVLLETVVQSIHENDEQQWREWVTLTQTALDVE
jgi:hypothetical protein